MTIPVREIKGITSDLEGKLKGLEIKDSEDLLAKLTTPQARREFAAKMGVDPKMILELANRADLIRVKGIGGAYSDLLEQVGVDTVKELAVRVPENLQAKIEAVNAELKLTSRPPTVAMVEDWVKQAKALPKILEY